MVTELHVISDQKNIFSDERYIIPLYQRGYAWEEKHIVQLIDDIMDISDDGQYYIGSLIVHRRKDAFEIIDGQQRLTTLFLLLNYLRNLRDIEISSLSFVCRDKSNYTLRNIRKITTGTHQELIEDSKIQQELVSGYNIIRDRLVGVDNAILLNKLCRTILYRVEVPVHTDLNHYFEIMNTRGEQLEQSDVLKASLMSELQDDKKWQRIFSEIWDACRNIDGYIQMHFSKDLREEIFGRYWANMPSSERSFYSGLSIENRQAEGFTIKDVITSDCHINTVATSPLENQKVRFESIIDFPYFLLHTLRVFVHSKQITPQNDLLDTMLDDKKLVEAFHRVIHNGEIDQQSIKPKDFVKDFIICLLRTRYLFDRYVIKREFIGDVSQDGEWSLKEIVSYGYRDNRKASYKLTKVVADGCWYNEGYNKEILMLQAAMRVSYTSPKVMHWITKLLIWLTDYYNGNVPNGWTYGKIVENIAKEPVIDFLNKEKNLFLGVSTPHSVLNYLDFLLWKDNRNIDFNFEFRNSVEHWYPRNPSEGSFERWDDDGPEGVDRFGNLCLIQRNVNSKFSNLHPGAKKSTFQEMISKGSLKLRKMSEITTDNSALWREETCARHEEDMIALLKQACGI